VRLGMMYGPGGPGQQVAKKTQEAMRLPHSRGIAEMLGAINYAAAMAIVSRKLGFNKHLEAPLLHSTNESNPVFVRNTGPTADDLMKAAEPLMKPLGDR